jgi:hypothetical protein
MTVVSLCLGLDVSPKRLGWALARLEDGAPVACGMESIELPANGWGWQQAHLALGHVDFEAEKRNGEVHYVAIERPALPPKSGTNGAFNAGRAYQEAISAVRRRWPWAVVDEMQPSEWRRLAGLPGNASKTDVLIAAERLGFWDMSAGVPIAQDAADAACIALAGVRRNADTLAVPAGEAGR